MWAGIATLLSGVVTGLVLFIAIRVLTGLGEGAFYSNDRSLIAEKTPIEKRSLGMGVVITGLAFGITIATVFAPNMIELGGKVFGADQAWRMPFFIARQPRRCSSAPGSRSYFRGQERGLPYARAALHLGAYAAGGLAAVMAVYFVGDAAGLSDICDRRPRGRAGRSAGPSASSRARAASSARCCARATSCSSTSPSSPCCGTCGSSRSGRSSIVADAAHSSFGRSALIAAFNAGAGIIGFPVGGWLSDVAVRRGIGRKRARGRASPRCSAC